MPRGEQRKMSLSALNSPSLVASTGAGLFALLPYLERAVEDGMFSWTVLKGANLVAFAVNVLAVSRPGRIDGSEQTGHYNGTKDTAGSGDTEIERLSPGKHGRTLVSPAGWAFAIWGPIYLGEMCFVANQVLLSESAVLAPLIKNMTAPFVIANLMQSLWTAAFRPKYKGKKMFVSVALLSGTAYSLAKVHGATTGFSNPYSAGQYLFYVLPTTLHFGWTFAASLVNLNGAIALGQMASPKAMAWFGHASVVVASAAGVIITVGRSAPVFGGVISWALFAVADGMKKRRKNTEKEDPKRVGVYGARMQELLSTIGALSCGAVLLGGAVSTVKPRTR